MLMTSSENKAKDNDVAYYEPIISKSLNKKESRFFYLDNHKSIVKILNKCSANINDANKNFYRNLENIMNAAFDETHKKTTNCNEILIFVLVCT